MNFTELIKRLSQPRYRGRHIVAVRDKIFTARTGPGASALLNKLTKKYPRESLTVSYIPKADSLVLISSCKS